MNQNCSTIRLLKYLTQLKYDFETLILCYIIGGKILNTVMHIVYNSSI